MATIKHLSSKNSNYAAAESYLTFQHNEYTGLPILDEKGRPKLRDSYLLDTLECGESSFAMACLIANRKYGKNGGREDVKTHHYIISFDPKDAVENDLTMERAQALGLQFCKDNFPGHPAIVCTHPDGHNSAGNIHVHIVIGSLRVRTVERQPFMDKPCDWEAGKKHRCTSAMLRHLRVAVMEMCEQADLNQIKFAGKLKATMFRSASIGRSGADNAASTMPTPNSPPKGSSPNRPSTRPNWTSCESRSTLC